VPNHGSGPSVEEIQHPVVHVVQSDPSARKCHLAGNLLPAAGVRGPTLLVFPTARCICRLPLAPRNPAIREPAQNRRLPCRERRWFQASAPFLIGRVFAILRTLSSRFAELHQLSFARRARLPPRRRAGRGSRRAAAPPGRARRPCRAARSGLRGG
jgi:hypothetical protein